MVGTKRIQLHVHPESSVRDVFAIGLEWECPVFPWEPPKLRAQGGDNRERSQKCGGRCRNLGLKAMVCAVIQRPGLGSGFQPLLTLGRISHSTSLGSNFLTSRMGCPARDWGAD